MIRSFQVTSKFTLTPDNSLRMELGAEIVSESSSVPHISSCHVNLCNHTYWNLSGDTKSDILGHSLWMPKMRHALTVDKFLVGELL
jgi:galactose mutarotase-like enzyme